MSDVQTRGYQQEMLEASLRRNVVIAMDTGSGKTHIAILRMKIEAEREPNKISWFVAPTVGLCEQQRSVIRAALPLPVGLISGALAPDQWTDAGLWAKALSEHRIIVSTPQVLLDALRHAYVSLSTHIGLLVFDEAHHAADKHPYNIIMREFYDKCTSHAGGAKPFVLGMTASPIFGGNVESAFTKIERNLDAIILAPSLTRPELLKHVHRPTFKHIMHEPADYANATSPNVRALRAALHDLDITHDPSVVTMRETLPKLLAAEGPGSLTYTRLDQQLSRALHKKDTFVHEGLRAFERTARELCADIGTWAADWYVYNVVCRALGNRATGNTMHAMFAERNQKEKAYLAGILRRIDVCAPEYTPEAISAGCSDKTNKLIKCLRAEKSEWDALGEAYSGLIFITRRDAVLALSEVLTHHPETKDIFATGSLLGGSENSRRNTFLDITRTFLTQTQAETLDDFRAGMKNLVVSTAVAEEGIDIQACGNVIRWDIPQNMVSWAQSRGRARHRRSSVILMFQAGMAHASLFRSWERLEQEMVQKYTDEQRQRRVIAAQQEGADCGDGSDDTESDCDEFRIASTGAVVTLDSAIPHLAHFCNVLPSIMHDPEQPTYDIFPVDYPEGYHVDPRNHVVLPHPGPYGCQLTFPKLLPTHLRSYRTEQVYKTKKAARRRAAFMAYVAMYHAGLLNDNLMPLTSSFEKIQGTEIKALFADIEKRDGIANVRELLNPWAPLASSAPRTATQWWSNELRVEGLGVFRMLTQKQLPDMHFSDTLHDPNHGPRLFSVIPGNLCGLTAEDILAAKHYTRQVFSVFYGSRLNWDDLDFSYLFLPSEPQDDSLWDERRAWADSTRSAEGIFTARNRILAKAADFASHFASPSDVHIVLEANRGSNFHRFVAWQYDRLDAAEEVKVLSRYENAKGEGPEIQYPLILAIPQQNRKNFLLPCCEGAKDPEFIYLLPQRTSIILVNATDATLSLFLPSILRSVFVKLIARNLQDVLSQQAPSIRTIPLELIETALMAPSAIAHYNYERLEWLGDSVLKSITTIQLLAGHPYWPEGFLSKAKDCIVSNTNLAKSALGKQLYKYIIRKVFLVKKWAPDYTKDIPLDTGGADHEESIADEDSDLGSAENGDIIAQLSTKTLADVVESLIGAAYLSGGFECSIACIKAFEIGEAWKPIPSQVACILSRVQPLADTPVQLTYPEVMLGYVFKRKALLVEALMHTSCQSDLPTVSYERMEFLGDAILDNIVSEIIYSGEGKNNSPGHMSQRRASVVNSHFLAYVCLKTHLVIGSQMPRWDAATGVSMATNNQDIHLWQCILHSSHRILEEQHDTYKRYLRVKDQVEVAFASGSMFPWAALTSMQAPKFFSDIIESLLGAIYLDSEGNLGAVRKVLERLKVLKILRRIIKDDVDVRHPVSRISNWMSKYREKKVEYKTEIADGIMTCTLLVDGETIHSVSERHSVKTTSEEMKFRVAEEGISILEQRFGREQ